MSVNLRELKQVGAKYREKRRGRRMNSRVQIRLEWDGESGKRQKLEAVTRIVNPYGCMVVLTDSLEVEQRVALTNLATQASNAAVVVWKGNEEPEGWEYGVELVAPDMDFWGLEL
jgi:rRNA-processing protein FCF1